MKRITAIAIALAALVGTSYVGAVEAKTPASSPYCKAVGRVNADIVFQYETYSSSQRVDVVNMGIAACEMGRLANTPELQHGALQVIIDNSANISTLVLGQNMVSFQNGVDNQYRTSGQAKMERGQ